MILILNGYFPAKSRAAAVFNTAAALLFLAVHFILIVSPLLCAVTVPFFVE